MRKTCPECGSRRVVPIEYGMPDSWMFVAAERGEVVLGGCCVLVDPDGGLAMADRACLDCHAHFHGRRRRPQLT